MRLFFNQSKFCVFLHHTFEINQIMEQFEYRNVCWMQYEDFKLRDIKYWFRQIIISTKKKNINMTTKINVLYRGTRTQVCVPLNRDKECILCKLVSLPSHTMISKLIKLHLLNVSSCIHFVSNGVRLTPLLPPF